LKITLLGYGTRGDVQPAIVLGKGLAARGHAVRLAASNSFRGWIEGHGLEAFDGVVDVQALMASDIGRDWAMRGSDPLVQARIMKDIIDRFTWPGVEAAVRACEGAEVIFSSFTSDAYAASIAEALGAVHVSMPLQPWPMATRHGPASFAAVFPERASYLNYLVGKTLIEPSIWRWYGEIVNRLRRELLGLPPFDRKQGLASLRRALVVHGYSARVVPHPPDWPPNMHTAGYWFLDEHEGYRPPEALERFLASGEPPVCIGFGSMTSHDPAGLTRLCVEAVTRSGLRAILLSGWAGMGDVELPPSVLCIESAPHAWLFPRVAAVVHHGGAGTTAEGLRAGKPTVIVPHLGDQPFWGRRVASLGVGPKPIPRPRLSVERLSAAITQATSDPDMRRRAEELGRHIRAEDGLGAALAILERHLDAHRI
jgi:UDP:flavonoid glycosyltransferase YjiC (YdhE family)